MHTPHRFRWLLFALAIVVAPGRAGAQAHPTGYAGSAECMDCHKKEVTAFVASDKGKLLLQHPRNPHEALGCETCHGPGKQHAESGGDERGALVAFGKKSPAPVSVRNAVCLQCHEKTARMLWQGSAHESRNVACTDCHAIMHSDAERSQLKKGTVLETCGQCHAKQKAQQMSFSHMPLGETRIECTDCHNPHGSNAPKLLVANSVNETCFACHAEKRGPYLWEHAPVVESCTNCHNPHGGSYDKMLKLPRPRLCQQCHSSTGHPSIARTAGANLLPADAQFVLNRQCSNCHFNIHGSNHPSGRFFTR